MLLMNVCQVHGVSNKFVQLLYQFGQSKINWFTIIIGSLVLTLMCGIHYCLALGMTFNSWNNLQNITTDELLVLLHLHLLLRDNYLPSSMYQAKVLTNKVGFCYNNIHACSNGCVLFRKQ